MREAEVLCIGEVLWDSLPAGLSLGGAPLNVALHLRQLGVPTAIASRVGNDRLGDDALRAIASYGLATDLVQVDRELPTGIVNVTLDGAGNPEYEIIEPAAWDAIELTDALTRRASTARAIVFGSLTQRNPTTRATIERIRDTPALTVFDVNLRPPHDDPGVVRRSLHDADVVKLNDAELQVLSSWFELPGEPRGAAAALARQFGCRTVFVTRGNRGAALWNDGAWTEHTGVTVDVKDTVGAGDAFLAAALGAILAGKDDGALLDEANLLGAYVATCSGAVPRYDRAEVSRWRSAPLIATELRPAGPEHNLRRSSS